MFFDRNEDFFGGISLEDEKKTASQDAGVYSGPNPFYQGIRIKDKDDLFPQGFSKVELDAAYARLYNDPHDAALICESPTMDELDYYNPGQEEISEDFVLEAITVDKFSKTEKRMAAVVRVFNKHLSESEINALPPIVGKPKQSGGFAYVIVQLPFSDGQTVNVVFHSPEGDKKKIAASDTIIAFRWLLNKRDITQVVAPEDGSEISLETIAKRVTQLVVKNSAKFEKQQKAAQAERQELDKARENLKEAEERQENLMDQIADLTKETEGIEAQLANTLALVEKQKVINAELQAKIDALKKAPPKNGGGAPNPNDNIGNTGNNNFKHTDTENSKYFSYSHTNPKTGNLEHITFEVRRDTAQRNPADIYPWTVFRWVEPKSKWQCLEKDGKFRKDKGQVNEYKEFKTLAEAVAEIEKIAESEKLQKAQVNNGTATNPSTTGTISDKKFVDDILGPSSDNSAFVNDLNDIIAGKYDSYSDKIDQLLDQAAAQAESAGQFDANEDLFNQAADHLTELLKAKAGNI